jgi:hypothetical protein
MAENARKARRRDPPAAYKEEFYLPQSAGSME